jgi:hypothetical protein
MKLTLSNSAKLQVEKGMSRKASNGSPSVQVCTPLAGFRCVPRSRASQNLMSGTAELLGGVAGLAGGPGLDGVAESDE